MNTVIKVELTQTDERVEINWSDSPIPTALAFDQLIALLAASREGMEPAVPMKPPPELTVAHGPVDAPWHLAMNMEGRLTLGLRHGGLGWLYFQPAELEKLSEVLSTQLAQQKQLRDELG